MTVENGGALLDSARSRSRTTSPEPGISQQVEATPTPVLPSPIQRSASEAGRDRELNVLIIDHDQDLLAVATSVLESGAHRVTAIRRVSDGEKRLREHVDDVVLLDLCMSRASGSKLLKTALRGHGGRRVILTMARGGSVESLFEALGAGAWDHLRKPFSATALLDLVGRSHPRRSPAEDPARGSE